MSILFVAIGGFFGSIARFYLAQQLNRPFIGTWLANVTGSILLGFVVHLNIAGHISHASWLFLGTGFCGAYTTFSTFGYETLQLILTRKYRAAIGYVVSSLAISTIFVGIIVYLGSL